MKSAARLTVACLYFFSLIAGPLPAFADDPTPQDQNLRQVIQSLEKRISDLEKEAAGGSPGVSSSGKASTPAESPASSEPQPFDFADFTWVNGNSRAHSSPLDTKYFTPEIRVDTNYILDF